MSRILLGSMIACAFMCFSGCGGGNTAAIDEGYSSSTPRTEITGPAGAGAADEGPANSEMAPPPPE